MRKRPGEVRDAIVHVLGARPQGATVAEITHQVAGILGEVPASSVRSYLQLNTPALFARTERAQYVLNEVLFRPRAEKNDCFCGDVCVRQDSVASRGLPSLA